MNQEELKARVAKLEDELHKNTVLLRDVAKILANFDYERDEDSDSKSFFKARINEDWFFHVKHAIDSRLEVIL